MSGLQQHLGSHTGLLLDSCWGKLPWLLHTWAQCWPIHGLQLFQQLCCWPMMKQNYKCTAGPAVPLEVILLLFYPWFFSKYLVKPMRMHEENSLQFSTACISHNESMPAFTNLLCVPDFRPSWSSQRNSKSSNINWSHSKSLPFTPATWMPKTTAHCS